MTSTNQKRIQELEAELAEAKRRAALAEYEAQNLLVTLREVYYESDLSAAPRLQELVIEAISHNNGETRMQQRDLNIAYATVSRLRFPVELRKMWSGGEVQQWLEQMAEVLHQRAIAHQQDRLDKKETLQ